MMQPAIPLHTPFCPLDSCVPSSRAGENLGRFDGPTKDLIHTEKYTSILLIRCARSDRLGYISTQQHIDSPFINYGTLFFMSVPFVFLTFVFL